MRYSKNNTGIELSKYFYKNLKNYKKPLIILPDPCILLNLKHHYAAQFTN